VGPITGAVASPVYLDTNVFVYALEGFEQFEPLLRELFGKIQDAQLRAVTSELTLAEVLVKPLADGRTDVCTAYLAAVQDSEALEVVPVTRDVLIEAAGIRARLGVRLPDAIHVATALSSGCRSFLTNDRSIRDIPNTTVIYLSDIAG
jgi:predicted nucleic acid-binding protein